MKPNQLATLVLRLLGVYCLALVIPTISFGLSAVSLAQAEPADGKDDRFFDIALVVSGVLPIFIRLATGVLLLVQSRKWGERLVPKDCGQENITAVSFEQAQLLAFAIVGVLIFASALPSTFKSIFNLAQSLTDSSVYWASRWRQGTEATGSLIEAVLGLVLFFRAHWFVKFWRSFQSSANSICEK